MHLETPSDSICCLWLLSSVTLIMLVKLHNFCEVKSVYSAVLIQLCSAFFYAFLFSYSLPSNTLLCSRALISLGFALKLSQGGTKWSTVNSMQRDGLEQRTELVTAPALQVSPSPASGSLCRQVLGILWHSPLEALTESCWFCFTAPLKSIRLAAGRDHDQGELDLFCILFSVSLLPPDCPKHCW